MFTAQAELVLAVTISITVEANVYLWGVKATKPRLSYLSVVDLTIPTQSCL